MTTRTKNVLAALLTALLSIFLGVTCNAQSELHFTPPPTHPELQENGESCNCMAEVAKFSCVPDCEFTKIESMLSGKGVPITRVTAFAPFSIDVTFTFADGIYTYEGVGRVVFNAYACQVLYGDGRYVIIKNFKEILLTKRN